MENKKNKHFDLVLPKDIYEKYDEHEQWQVVQSNLVMAIRGRRLELARFMEMHLKKASYYMSQLEKGNVEKQDVENHIAATKSALTAYFSCKHELQSLSHIISLAGLEWKDLYPLDEDVKDDKEVKL